MYLTSLAKTIEGALTASSPENWTGSGIPPAPYVVPDDVAVAFAMDPYTMSGTSTPTIFVVPAYIEYNFETVRKIKYTKDRKLIIVSLSMKVPTPTDTPDYDVTSEMEAIKLADLKEDLDEFLANLKIDGAVLRDMETEPFDELQMNDSYFLVTTTLSYAAC